MGMGLKNSPALTHFSPKVQLIQRLLVTQLFFLHLAVATECFVEAACQVRPRNGTQGPQSPVLLRWTSRPVARRHRTSPGHPTSWTAQRIPGQGSAREPSGKRRGAHGQNTLGHRGRRRDVTKSTTRSLKYFPRNTCSPPLPKKKRQRPWLEANPLVDALARAGVRVSGQTRLHKTRMHENEATC